MGRGSVLGKASLAVSSSLGRCTKSSHFGIVDHVQYSIHHGAYGVVGDMFDRERLDAAIDTPGFPSSSILIMKNLVIRMTKSVPEEL